MCKVNTVHSNSASSRNYDIKSTKFKAIKTAIKITQVSHDSQIKIMEQIQPEERRAAAKEFQESLEQLQQILQENATEDEQTPELDTGTTNQTEVAESFAGIDMAAFEDAVADIEQYMESKQKKWKIWLSS